MSATEYTLTGFDDFLERRRIVFVEPLPSTRVCSTCGVVPSRSLILPCGHVLCQACKSHIANGDEKCPLDGGHFREDDVVAMSFKQSDLEQRRVFCVAGGLKCSFAGKLSDLKAHLIECGSDEMSCAKCQKSLVSRVAVEHYRLCCAGTRQSHTVSITAIASAVEKLGSMKKDLESIREQASSEEVERHSVVNGANSLMERITSLVRDMIQVGTEVGEAKFGSLLPTVNVTRVTTGPYRAASKAGVFIATCEFSDVYAGYNSLNWRNTECILATKTYTLAGYMFKLDCKLQLERNQEVVLSFALCLHGGVWDDWLEWPFSRKVTIVLTHPRDDRKDVRLPVSMEGPKVVKKPAPESLNAGNYTKTEKWGDLEFQGFFYKKSLYVNVEFE